MISQPNLRRARNPHAPLPKPLNPLMCCKHGAPACDRCVPEGTLLFRNHDIEASSWREAPRKAA